MSLCEILLDVWEAVPDQKANIDKVEWPQNPYKMHFSLGRWDQDRKGLYN